MYFWAVVFSDGEETYLVTGPFRHVEPADAEEEFRNMKEAGTFLNYCQFRFNVPLGAIVEKIYVACIIH